MIMTSLYDEPENPALPAAGFRFDPARTALVVTDP
jgi:hypothetical protein